jgi:D-alanyl-D-alanine carboxypeptidase (penicillin-binding protein 5/6)
MSANDAAVTLAEKISGSVPQFVARMNQEAQALG